MNQILDVASMEFAADLAGAIEETRVSPRVVVAVIEGAVKVATAVFTELF